MTDDLHSPIATALRDRVRDEHPDLDELVRLSTDRGGRLRRRRRAAAALGVVAGTAAASTCVLLLSGSGGSSADDRAPDPGFAAQPSSSTSPQQREVRLDRLAARLRHQARADGAPLVVSAPGWNCADPSDEKIACTRGPAFVSVNWRPVADRDAFLDPGKADTAPRVHTFVSEAHGRWFATVSPGSGATQADVDQVAAGVQWLR